MNKNITVLLIGIIASTLVACADVDSKDIRTSGIYAEISVRAQDDTAHVFARLRTGRALDNDTVLLSPGDQLSASVSGRSIPLYETETEAYSGVLENVSGGSEIFVKFTRIDDVDAPNTRAILPEEFDISAPSPAETYNAGESITVVWSPGDPSNTVSVSYSLDCTVYDANGIPSGAAYGRGYSVADSGTHTASINQILNVVGTQDNLVRGVSCPLEVAVKRINDGTLDNAFTKGGTISAIRERSVLVNVIP